MRAAVARVDFQAGERNGAIAPFLNTAAGSARRLFHKIHNRFRRGTNISEENGQVPDLPLWCLRAVPGMQIFLVPQQKTRC